MSQFISTMIPDPENHVRRDGKLARIHTLKGHLLTLCSIHDAKGHRPAIRHGSEL